MPREEHVFSIDVKIVGTAYVRATSKAAAMRAVKALKMCGLEIREDLYADIPISGQRFNNPDLPELSLSPAMTVYGPANHLVEDHGACGVDEVAL